MFKKMRQNHQEVIKSNDGEKTSLKMLIIVSYSERQPASILPCSFYVETFQIINNKKAFLDNFKLVDNIFNKTYIGFFL